MELQKKYKVDPCGPTPNGGNSNQRPPRPPAAPSVRRTGPTRLLGECPGQLRGVLPQGDRLLRGDRLGRPRWWIRKGLVAWWRSRNLRSRSCRSFTSLFWWFDNRKTVSFVGQELKSPNSPWQNAPKAACGWNPREAVDVTKMAVAGEPKTKTFAPQEVGKTKTGARLIKDQNVCWANIACASPWLQQCFFAAPI